MDGASRAALKEDQNRAAYMEWLYRMSRRGESNHPKHGLFTGLLEERKNLLVEIEKDVVSRRASKFR